MRNLKPTKYPLHDKQVIASAFGQLWINFTCNFKVFQNALVASRFRQFCENFEIRVKLILNCPRAHAITYIITYGAKLLSADWLRQRPIFSTRALFVIKRA